MISAIIKATKPADARPLIDLAGAARSAAGRRGRRLLRRRRLLLMQTSRAASGDWPSVRDLLTEAGLPLDGAAEAFATGVVARDGDRLVGCAAIEPYGGAALLRSVAVVPDQRGTGVGTSLVHAVEDLARDRGASDRDPADRDRRAWFSRLGYDASRSLDSADRCRPFGRVRDRLFDERGRDAANLDVAVPRMQRGRTSRRRVPGYSCCDDE